MWLTTGIQGTTGTNTYQYTGRENDGTGLYFYRNRYYSPLLDRFIGEDPLRLDDGSSFYAYTGDSPTNWVDPMGLDWIKYTGQSLTVYGGNLGDTSLPLQECRASSGYPGKQSPSFQNQELGPVPEGTYRINLSLSPFRYAGLNPDSTTVPGTGVQLIPGYSSDWGSWRARLEKVNVHSNRDGMYLHNSSKGYTHGCVETCTDLYDRLVMYHDQGIKWLPVSVQYSGDTTYGNTRQ